MRKHFSIFAFLLGAFAAGFAFEAGAGQTVYGGYYYFAEKYIGISYSRMSVNDDFMPVTLSKAGDKAVCKATEPDGMRVGDEGWGHVTGTSEADVDLAVSTFNKLTWESKSTPEYEWTYDGHSLAHVAIAVRFDYIKYTLKFASSQGGTVLEDREATYEQSVTIPAPSSSSAPTGYHFDKWIATSSFDKAFSADVSAGSSVSGKDFGLAGCHKDGSVITLTAQWAPNTYDVKSGGENCTVTVAASAAYDGDLAINWTPDGAWKKPTVTVYSGTDDKGTVIKTYSSLPEGTGSTTFKMSELRAYYEKIFIKVSYEVHTLTFNPNGGSCDETSRRVERGALIGELPVATQYQRTQEGWWDDPGAGNPITAATVYNFPGDVTAYAHWKVAELFSVDTIADPEEGGTLTGGGSYAKDEQITLTATANNGYSFVKWTAKTSGEEHADPSWPITVVAGDLYTAHFTGNVYKVTFMAPEGTPTKQERFVTFGSEYGDLPTATWTEDESDMVLAGWNTDPDGEGDMVFSNTVVSVAGKQTLYAMWKPIPTYHIAYNGNGSTSGAMADQKMYCGVADNLTSNAYERIGYHFRGWATNTADAAALKIAYADGALVTDIAFTNETATLYAVWEAITLGEAMHCNDPSLVWESYNPKDYQTDNDWKAIFDTGVGDGTDSCVRQTGAQLSKQRWLVAKVSEEGSLSFRWKPTDVGGKLMFWVDAGKDNDAAKTEPGQSGTSGEWSTFSTNNIPAGSWLHFYFLSSTGTCDIDQMTWTPGGPEPVDGKDNVTISSAAVSDGKFTLSFKSDEKFDYNLLTNANLLIKEGWGVMGEKKTGDGSVLTFEPEIIEGQPQLFYKVETIQRK